MIIAVLVAYFIGSIPFALMLARRSSAQDLREVGSGNLGAANVARVSGVRVGVLVALLDMAKGAASVLLAQRLNGSPAGCAAAGLAAIVGHVYPVWLQFRGGKGVATAGGVFAVLTPLAAAPALALFLLALFGLRYFLRRTLSGAVILAVTEDREAATSIGINAQRVYLVTFIIGAIVFASK